MLGNIHTFMLSELLCLAVQWREPYTSLHGVFRLCLTVLPRM